jgi:hypothetical protein
MGIGAVVHWYSGSCGGTSAGTGNPLTINKPAATTTYYARYEGCNTTTCASVTVTVAAQPIAPTLNIQSPTNSTICTGTTVSATFNAGSGGVGCSDDYTVSIDGGAAVAYTPGSSVGGTATTSIEIKEEEQVVMQVRDAQEQVIQLLQVGP